MLLLLLLECLHYRLYLAIPCHVTVISKEDDILMMLGKPMTGVVWKNNCICCTHCLGVNSAASPVVTTPLPGN